MKRMAVMKHWNRPVAHFGFSFGYPNGAVTLKIQAGYVHFVLDRAPSAVRRSPNPPLGENSGKHKLFSMPREPAQPDDRGQGGVKEGSEGGQRGVRGGSGRGQVECEPMTLPLGRPLIKNICNCTLTVDICKGHDQYQDQYM